MTPVIGCHCEEGSDEVILVMTDNRNHLSDANRWAWSRCFCCFGSELFAIEILFAAKNPAPPTICRPNNSRHAMLFRCFPRLPRGNESSHEHDGVRMSVTISQYQGIVNLTKPAEVTQFEICGFGVHDV
jgi:hypothetical protein